MSCLGRKCGRLGIWLQHQHSNLDIPVDCSRMMFLGFLRRLDSRSLVLREWLSNLPLGFRLVVPILMMNRLMILKIQEYQQLRLQILDQQCYLVVRQIRLGLQPD